MEHMHCLLAEDSYASHYRYYFTSNKIYKIITIDYY